jgi:hypothetical protein
MSNLPQPPEGILDPQKPWHLPMPKRPALWGTLKARLTGRPNEYGNYSSYVNISEAEADTLIANMKKDPRGYPQLDQTSGTPSQWMERQKLYQEWLVESYLENPFREQVDKKIEDAAIERRLQEIQEEREKAKANQQVKPSEPVPTSQEEEQDLADEKETEKQVIEITNELDKESEKEKQQTQPTPAEEKKEEETNKNLDRLEDALKNIKASISSQTSIVSSINATNQGSLTTLGAIQDIFLAQTELLRQQQELKEISSLESSLESGQDLSGSAESTSTMDDGSAEAEITKVDGDVLTIKPLEGNFKEGQKISTGGGGFDLLGMLKGIAGKFSGGGKAGAASPTKLSRGGIAVGPKKLAQGGFQPGIYKKPTVGNLMPGQAVIPLNRNVGKKLTRGTTPNSVAKKNQSLATTMEQPIKAIGGAIIAMAGNVLKSLGALAGFFVPYIKPLIGTLGRALAIPVSVIESLLGGPAFAATTDLKQQTNIFADIWSGLMDRFGFVFGGSDKDKKQNDKRRTPPGTTPSTATGKWGPLLDVIASGEGNYTSVNPSLQRPEIVNKTISELVAFQYQSKASHGGTAASGRYQMLHPETYAKNAGLSMDEKFTPENQDKMAAAYIEKIRRGNDWLAGKITDEDFGKELAKEWAALEYPGKGGGYYDGDGRNKAKVSFEKVKGALEKVKAEKGVSNSQGKAVDAFTLTGPNSGYQVPGIGEMHGKEAVIQYEKGFTVLPIENRLFSMETDPLNTILRWKELLGPSMNSYGKRSFAAGGKVTLYSGHADMTSDSPGGKGTNGGPDGGAPKIPQASGYFTTEAYLNDKIAAMAASKSGGVAEYRSPVRTRNGSDPDSNWERARKDVAAGKTPIEIHHDAESGKPGLIASGQSAINKNPFFKSVNSSFGFYRTGDEGFVTRGGAILEMDALKKSIRDNPSSWISSASTKLANALRKSANVSPTAEDEMADTTGETSSNEEQQKPMNPFEEMEKSIKGMAVGMGLMEAARRGEVTDEASYKAVKERLSSAVSASPDNPIKQTNTAAPAATPLPPNVQIVNSDDKKMIITTQGGKRNPVGILEDNVCRLFQ